MSGTVTDASPLIILERVGRLELLPPVFGEIWVPPAVIQETFAARVMPSWLTERQLSRPIDERLRRSALGAGEREAITLALNLDVEWVVLDDEAARRAALALGLPVIGILGVLLKAKQSGVIVEVRPLIQSLLASGFRAAPSLIGRVLRAAAE